MREFKQIEIYLAACRNVGFASRRENANPQIIVRHQRGWHSADLHSAALAEVKMHNMAMAQPRLKFSNEYTESLHPSAAFRLQQNADLFFRVNQFLDLHHH